MEQIKFLNNIQQECVKNTEGPMIIISGPGSGKTRVITSKIAYILSKGVNPYNILALTFTNKSAKELLNRIQSISSNVSLWKLWAGTFHSMFARILRIESQFIGYNNHFTILDNEDSKSMIKRIINDFKLDKENYRPNGVFSKISLLKNNLIDPYEYEKNHEFIKNDENKNQPKFLLIYRTYINKCKQNQNMDFDDLLVNTLNLFRKNNSILEKYQEIFKYILIDEFQDTNILQLEIIKLLAKKNNNLCVVGDDSQSIYSFRGANINNILNFNKLYPLAKIFKLEENYRSTKIILKAANSLISHNEQKLEKKIWTNKENGEKINLNLVDSDKEEGLLIAKTIKELYPSKKFSDHLVLFRMNSQSRVIEEGLRRLNINYKVFGLSFYKRKEIKDVLAYLKLITNKLDDESLIRIINYPARGIGKTSIERIREFAFKNNISLWEVISKIKNIDIKINEGLKGKIHDFFNLIESYSSRNSENAFDLVISLVDGLKIFEILSNDQSVESNTKIENIRELLNAIKSFTEEQENNTIANFLDQSVLVNESDNEENSNNDDFVSLMTIHQSKGLEFSQVHIAGMEDNIFPSQQSMFSQKDIEEERRLLYVAITRAKDKVYMSHCKSRFRFNNYVSNEPSRFINEIDENCIEKNETKNYISALSSHKSFQRKANEKKFDFKTPKKNLVKITKFKTSKDNIKTKNLNVGRFIIHNIFGKGKIVSLTDSNEKMEVEFENKSKKTILVRYAKFDLID